MLNDEVEGSRENVRRERRRRKLAFQKTRSGQLGTELQEAPRGPRRAPRQKSASEASAGECQLVGQLGVICDLGESSSTEWGGGELCIAVVLRGSGFHSLVRTFRMRAVEMRPRAGQRGDRVSDSVVHHAFFYGE